MKVMVVDVGGTHVKVLTTGKRMPRKLPSGPRLTPREMVRSVLSATADWEYEAVSIGYPGPVSDNRPTREPANLGRGWVRFDYAAAFNCPVRIVNDAAMQALGSYDGGQMLFLGLGTGLGTTLVRDGIVIPLEMAHLPYLKGRTYEEYLGDAGLKRLGRRRWRDHVAAVVSLFLAALVAEYVVLGGGNVRLLDDLPPNSRRGNNLHAFRGGYRLWQKGAHLS
jgi:predicted NBD/HSP70 family sugar kinase